MMRNLTISVEDEVLRWARVAAAHRDCSVSRFVGDLLKERMEGERAYEAAMSRSTARVARPLKSEASRYPTRDELHE